MGTTDQNETYEGWSILELFGHRRLGGYVREVKMFGATMCRIDVPCDPPATQFYGGASIYCMTPTTEEIATAIAERQAPAPVQRWELPARVGVSAHIPHDDEYDDDKPPF